MPCENLDYDYTFTHYILGGSIPVRVLWSRSRGLKAGAQVPDRHTGKLEYKHEYLSRIETSYEVEEIDQAAFEAACEQFLNRDE